NSDSQTICKTFKKLRDKYINFGYKEVMVEDRGGSKLIGTEIYYNYDKYKEYTESFIEKLKFLKVHLIDENKKNENEINGINIINNNSNTANSTINQNFGFKTTIQYINKIPNEILDKKLKTELLGILTEIEHADEKESKKEKFMKAIKWLGDKSVDVAIQILPYLAGIKF
nr:hypothetical protein [Campylobacter sp.]